MVPGMPIDIVSSQTTGRRILVVDDEDFIRMLIRERLEMSGYVVDEARNGKAALEALQKNSYAVMLTDIRMPEMDGISLLRETAFRCPEMAGIVMSAYAELDTAVTALKMGACDYITKPFNFDVLLITIENAVRKKTVERQLQDYQVNLEAKVREQTEIINVLYLRSIDVLIKALEAKDLYTRGHSQRVTIFSFEVGKAMGYKAERLENLRRASILHDLGKIGVREAILNKPARLTDEEYREITLHPEVATRILEPIPFFEPLLPAILHHHERFDGKGYPAHLAGMNIPEESRIMAIADTYDAMTSTRAYRKALPVEAAHAELRRCAGSQFDPDIVPVFLEVQPKVEVPPEMDQEELFQDGAGIPTVASGS